MKSVIASIVAFSAFAFISFIRRFIPRGTWQMEFPRSPGMIPRCFAATLGALLITLPAGGEQAPVPPAPPASPAPPSAAPASNEKPKSAGEPATAEGMTKRERKAEKRERQREAMLKRIENRVPGDPSSKPTPPPPPPSIHNPYQFAEDFDRDVHWEQKDNDAGKSNPAYGYGGTNHLASAGCAPGEIGGSVSDSSISWFADNREESGANRIGVEKLSAGVRDRLGVRHGKVGELRVDEVIEPKRAHIHNHCSRRPQSPIRSESIRGGWICTTGSIWVASGRSICQSIRPCTYLRRR